MFDLDPTGSILTFDVAVRNHLGEIAFSTDPEDAPVTFRIEVDGPVEGPGVFLGREEPVPAGVPITLSPSDPRVTDSPGDYASAALGIYIHAVRLAAAPRARLAQEALERLRALGYVDSRAAGGD